MLFGGEIEKLCVHNIGDVTWKYYGIEKGIVATEMEKFR